MVNLLCTRKYLSLSTYVEKWVVHHYLNFYYYKPIQYKVQARLTKCPRLRLLLKKPSCFMLPIHQCRLNALCKFIIFAFKKSCLKV